MRKLTAYNKISKRRAIGVKDIEILSYFGLLNSDYVLRNTGRHAENMVI